VLIPCLYVNEFFFCFLQFYFSIISHDLWLYHDLYLLLLHWYYTRNPLTHFAHDFAMFYNIFTHVLLWFFLYFHFHLFPSHSKDLTQYYRVWKILVCSAKNVRYRIGVTKLQNYFHVFRIDDQHKNNGLLARDWCWLYFVRLYLIMWSR
jgi:hypothetical protein